MRTALRAHWPEYLIEATGLGAFMLVACLAGTLLGHPASPAVRALPDPLARRALMGVAMGLTAVGLIDSPWGRRSGAHFNPATTLPFGRLGKIAPADAALLLAAELHVRRRGLAAVFCAKLQHDGAQRCIFRCRHHELAPGQGASS
jgi:aquaporin Z